MVFWRSGESLANLSVTYCWILSSSVCLFKKQSCCISVLHHFFLFFNHFAIILSLLMNQNNNYFCVLPFSFPVFLPVAGGETNHARAHNRCHCRFQLKLQRGVAQRGPGEKALCAGCAFTHRDSVGAGFTSHCFVTILYPTECLFSIAAETLQTKRGKKKKKPNSTVEGLT